MVSKRRDRSRFAQNNFNTAMAKNAKLTIVEVS